MQNFSFCGVGCSFWYIFCHFFVFFGLKNTTWLKPPFFILRIGKLWIIWNFPEQAAMKSLNSNFLFGLKYLYLWRLQLHFWNKFLDLSPLLNDHSIGQDFLMISEKWTFPCQVLQILACRPNAHSAWILIRSSESWSTISNTCLHDWKLLGARKKAVSRMFWATSCLYATVLQWQGGNLT